SVILNRLRIKIHNLNNPEYKTAKSINSITRRSRPVIPFPNLFNRKENTSKVLLWLYTILFFLTCQPLFEKTHIHAPSTDLIHPGCCHPNRYSRFPVRAEQCVSQ